jgi:PAS domain-containing protein
VRILPGPAAPRDALRLVLETALDAVVVMKSDGVVADWNDRAPVAASYDEFSYERR